MMQEQPWQQDCICLIWEGYQQHGRAYTSSVRVPYQQGSAAAQQTYTGLLCLGNKPEDAHLTPESNNTILLPTLKAADITFWSLLALLVL